jgi:hypothetical protein
MIDLRTHLGEKFSIAIDEISYDIGIDGAMRGRDKHDIFALPLDVGL